MALIPPLIINQLALTKFVEGAYMYIIHTLVPGVHDQKEITCTHRLRKLPIRFILFCFSFYSRRFTPYYKTLHNELTQLAMHIRLLLSTKTVRYILPWVPEDFLPRLSPDSLWQRQHNDNKTNNADDDDEDDNNGNDCVIYCFHYQPSILFFILSFIPHF